MARAKTAMMRLGGVGDIVAPPSYDKVSSQFGSLESFTESCNNKAAAYYLQKARVSFLKAYASKPARPADTREFGSA